MKKTVLFILTTILLFHSKGFSQAPVNDNCENAIKVEVNDGILTTKYVQGNSDNATQSLPPVSSENHSISDAYDVWFSFKATSNNHTIIFKSLDSSNSFNPYFLEARSGLCSNSNFLATTSSGTDNMVKLRVSNLNIGENYFIRVYMFIPVPFTIAVNQEYDVILKSDCPRTKLISKYINVFQPTTLLADDITWTGDTTSCNEGTISKIVYGKSLAAINYYRELVGLPGNVVYSDSLNAIAQKTALIMASNKTINHFPPTTYKCYSSIGAAGAKKSNLAMSWSDQFNAIQQYVDDGGTNNVAVGHRRWVLHSKAKTFGYGQTKQDGPSYTAWYNALYVITNENVTAPTIDFIAFPNEGNFPLPLYPTSNRWSFGIPGADFSASTVEMKDVNGASISLKQNTVANGYGDNTIVWEPSGLKNSTTEETPYTVTVKNVSLNGSKKDYTYVVKITPLTYPPSCPNGKTWSDLSCGCEQKTTELISLQNDEKHLLIYPNPTTDAIYVSNIEGKSISIFGMNGVEIFSQSNTPNTLKINLNDIVSKGFYFVQITNEDGSLFGTKKIILE